MGAAAEPCERYARRWKAVALPTSAVLWGQMLVCERTGAVGGPDRIASRSSGGTSGRAAGIAKGPGGGPHSHNDAPRGATGRTAGRARGRGHALWWPAIAGMALDDQEADGRERDSPAGLEQAEVADCHKAIGPDRREEAAETLSAVEAGGAEASTAHVPVGARTGTIREADETVVGDGNLADLRGAGRTGGVAVVLGLTVDIPGDGPDLGGEVLQQTDLAHLFFADGTGDGGEGFDRDKAVGPGGPPGRAVLGEAPTRDAGVKVGVVLALPAPGVPDPGAPREIGADAALVGGEPFEGERRRLQQGLVREALMGADAGSARLRDGAGEEDMRSRELCVQVVR